MNDPYEILGVDKDATPEEINKAYKDAAKKAHPDSGGSAAKFTRIKQASLVLLDPTRRKQFDENGTVNESTADTVNARSMELVAQFFINSINLMNNPHSPPLEQTDLVLAGTRHFNQLIAAGEANIKEIDKQINRFNRALKRLKTKRKNDIIKKMIEHHVGVLRMTIENNKREIVINSKAILLLGDYEFETGGSTAEGMQQYYIQNPFGMFR